MIKKATEDDIAQLAVLFDAYRVFYHKPSDINGAINFLTARIQNNESIIYAATHSDGRLIGFTQLYPSFSSMRMKKIWVLNDLFVHPDFRSLGHSIALIEMAKQLAKSTNSASLILETDKTNIIGNNLYPKTGFILEKEHNYYYWDV